MPDESLDPDLAALSAALGGLTPASPALSRDRLLYEAGRRAVRPRRGPWPIVAGLFALLSAGLGARLATARPDVQFVYLPEASRERERPEFSNPKTPVADAPGSPLTPRSAGAEYLHLRDQVVRFGADSLPAVTSGPAQQQPPVEKMLGLPWGTLTDPQKTRWEHQLFQGGA
jgi:hypothetical protein